MNQSKLISIVIMWSKINELSRQSLSKLQIIIINFPFLRKSSEHRCPLQYAFLRMITLTHSSQLLLVIEGSPHDD